MTQHKTILVVDDDQLLRAGLRTVLQEHGYSTLEADDGLEACKIIDDCRPDLVILDMMMPRWGGLAVLEHFRGKPEAPLFIMITANDGPKYREHAERIGVADYIHKPFSMQCLLGGIGKSLAHSLAASPDDEAKRAAMIRCRCRSPRCPRQSACASCWAKLGLAPAANTIWWYKRHRLTTKDRFFFLLMSGPALNHLLGERSNLAQRLRVRTSVP